MLKKGSAGVAPFSKRDGGSLVSSKVNQWALLVGLIPLIFAVSSGGLGGLPVDPVQREELLLTAAQSVFAVALIADLRLSGREAIALAGIYFAEFLLVAFIPPEIDTWVRIVTALVYLVLAAVIIVGSPTSASRVAARWVQNTYGRTCGGDSLNAYDCVSVK